MGDLITIKKQVEGCSAMKSALGSEGYAVRSTPSPQVTEQVHVNETAQPLAFTFIPSVRRLPVHIQVINTTRSSPCPRKPQKTSSIMNEPLHITEELPSTDVTMTDTIDRRTPVQQAEISQSWSNKGGDVSAEESGSLEGIFKAELVFLADSYGTDSDCYSGENEAEVDLSTKKLPLSSLSPNSFVDDKNGSIQKELEVYESKSPMLQDAEQKMNRAVQEPFFQSSTSSCTPDNVITQPLTSTTENGDSSAADTRRICSSTLLNKSSFCFPTNSNLEKKSSSFPRSTVFTSLETSFISSNSLPSALNTTSLFPFSASFMKSKTISPSYPPFPLHFLSCSDLQSSPTWSSSTLPSSQSTICSSTHVQSSLHSSSQNTHSSNTWGVSCHSPRILHSSSQASTHVTAAKSTVVPSPPTQLSLLTSILRSGKRPSVSPNSSEQSKPVSSTTSLIAIGSQSPSKFPVSTTLQVSSSCPKAKTISPTPLTPLPYSSGKLAGVSSISSRSLTTLSSPESGKNTLHCSFTSLSQKHGNTSTESTETLPSFSSIKHHANYSRLSNSTPTMISLSHATKPPTLPHCPFPRHGLLPPSTGQFTSYRFSPNSSFSPAQKIEPPLSDLSLPSEGSSKISPTPHYSSFNYYPGEIDTLSLVPKVSSLSPTARPYNISCLSEQSVPSSTASMSSSSTQINSSPQSGSLTPTPLNVNSVLSTPRSISVSSTQNEIVPHSSSLGLSSHSHIPNYSFSQRPSSPGQLSFHLSPFSRSNANVINSAHPTAQLSNPRLEITTSSSAQSPPPPSHFSKPGTKSPAQSLSYSTEIEPKKPQKYKIKSSYKAFAAIPTNTLLLEQKAIDEAISDSEESAAAGTSEKTHSQFLLESESLRQQTEELYATIEQLLEDPLPTRSSSSTPNSLQKLQYSEAYKPINPAPKSAGRETKYANLHLSASESTESRPTRPGVIRPITAVQKVPAVPKIEETCHNLFRKHPEEFGDTEWLCPLSTILTSVSHPSLCHKTYQPMLCSQDTSQSIPLSLSPVTCLTSGSQIRFSPIAPCNYYMTSNLSRSLHSLYIKPRHSITTIHENEALGINELTDATTELNRDQYQSQNEERGLETSIPPNSDYNQEALLILEEE
ncbi:mucin-5AC isoform X1 [Chiloscyllium plagiosum]|uniref:mucin-5AC isoform X1 n=2 Tax=Chiloscyllium plagiosum TaxID=36176 RepID=UPI001CB7D04B|nr:mucin-5AC isoform X1 [Chiloscyllium plagiosum]